MDRFTPYLSSSYAELKGLTALSIIARLFLDFHLSLAKVNAICDNQGVIQTCNSQYPPLDYVITIMQILIYI